MLARIGTLTAAANALYIASSVIASGKIMSAPASTHARARSIAACEALDRKRVGARHDHEDFGPSWRRPRP